MHVRIALLVACAAHAATVEAQTTSLSRAEAIRTALERGARVGLARADTAVAAAQVAVAGVVPNPSLTANYSKSVPRYHVTMDVPLDFLLMRQLRVRAAGLGLEAARLRNQLVRATIALDADTTYTMALAARERLALSRRNALDADSLLHMVERRRDAGDATEMDVELARVSAGQQANLAAGDSLTLISTLLDLQAVLGMVTERLEIRATDSLTMPPAAPTLPATTLGETAARLSLDSAAAGVRLQHRSIWSQLSISFGFETSDPDQPGLLPTYGFGIGLPLFDRNRGGIAQAEAEREHAAAELALARVEAKTQIARATRQREISLARAERERLLVTSAQRVEGMALTAYREGASTLANILEARRTSRELLAQYVDDLAAAWIATAELRALAASTSNPQP